MTNPKFRAALKKLVDDFPVDGAVLVEETQATSDNEPSGAALAGKKCVRWGRNPKTNELVCLQWEDA